VSYRCKKTHKETEEKEKESAKAKVSDEEPTKRNDILQYERTCRTKDQIQTTEDLRMKKW